MPAAASPVGAEFSQSEQFCSGKVPWRGSGSSQPHSSGLARWRRS